MKRQMIISILLGILSLTSQAVFAQISEGGTPISFSLDIDTRKEKIPVMEMPAVDAKALLEEDKKLRMKNPQRPFRFGYAIDVDIDIKKAGIKKELPDGGNLWLLKIHCPDAFSINLIYSHFILGKGSKFFIYNEDRAMILGAFTPEVSNNPDNKFATDLLQGNTIILEYYEPVSSDDGSIHIGKVIHGYQNTFTRDGLGISASCNVDVMCTLGNNWINERHAVVLILVDNNTTWCSGCLVNNTQKDFKPYILTARHCYYENNGNTPNDITPATNIFRFRYWRPDCGSGFPPPTNFSITGATLRAHDATTDFALLELSAIPPANFNAYYAGWDRSTTPAQNATGIHHPKGDAMKISYEQHPVFAHPNPNGSSVILSTWKVGHFENGTTQDGSSGSPLFNQNHRIVGQLSTVPDCEGDNTCACNYPYSNYGRFDMSWTGGGTSSTRLRDWLDPSNTVSVLDGCASTTFTDRTVTTNQTVVGCTNLNVQNVTVTSNAKLTLDAPGSVIITSDFKVVLGSELKIK